MSTEVRDSFEMSRRDIGNKRKESARMLEQLKMELSRKIATFVPPQANPSLHKQLSSGRVIEYDTKKKKIN